MYNCSFLCFPIYRLFGSYSNLLTEKKKSRHIKYVYVILENFFCFLGFTTLPLIYLFQYMHAQPVYERLLTIDHPHDRTNILYLTETSCGSNRKISKEDISRPRSINHVKINYLSYKLIS